MKNVAGYCYGRRPAGLLRPINSNDCPQPLACLFGGMAHLEAASIRAFVRLRRELRLHHAPANLVRAAERAARDEVRHTRMMWQLAEGHGASRVRVEVEPERSRSLFEIALENEVEGCVRETYGALVAAWQAQKACTQELRAAFSEIARDNAEHAGFAWKLRAWLRSQLTTSERHAVDEACIEALEDLRTELAQPLPPEWHSVAGIPRRPEALELVRGLEKHIELLSESALAFAA